MSSDSNTPEPQDLDTRTPRSFRERHALKVMGVVMLAMFSLVIVAQVGC